jgi:putative transcriptional regulator
MTIKNLREQAKLNTKEAAEKLSISLSMLYKIEQGQKKPGRELIKKISKVYSCSVEDIFFAINDTNSENNIHTA